MGMLRYLLAISVLSFHSGPILGCQFMGGEVAVKAFFILSGFYMALVLNGKYVGEKARYGLFLGNRFLRLYPVYLVVLLLTLGHGLWNWDTGAGRMFAWKRAETTHVLSTGTALSLAGLNLSLWGQSTVFYASVDSAGQPVLVRDFRAHQPELHHFLLVPQAWSISLELSFYAIAPFLLRWRFRSLAAATCLAALLSYLLFQAGLQEDPWTYRFLPAVLVYFLLGACCWHVYRWMLPRLEKLPRGVCLGVGMSILPVTVMYYAFPGRILFPEVYFASLFLTVPFLFFATRNSRADRWLGEISYPLYIGHLLINLPVRAGHVPLLEGRGLTLAILATAFAIVLHYAVARPVERWRQRRFEAS